MADMSLSALRTSLIDALMDAASTFSEDQLDLCLDTAAADLARVKPRVIRASLSLVADKVAYACPADLLKPLMLEWGVDALRTTKPWDVNWPGRLPDISLGRDSDIKSLLLTPAPTAAQITALSATAYYRYSGRYALGENASNTTVLVDDRDILLVRALAESMFMLARKNINKAVMVGKSGVGGMPKNGMPSVLAGELIKQFEKMAGKG